MKKNFKKSKIKVLNRSEIAAVIGGNLASCVANCGDGVVMCQGSNCAASDGLGCSSDSEIKLCGGSSPTLSDVKDHGN
jgi:hypothetical protein